MATKRIRKEKLLKTWEPGKQEVTQGRFYLYIRPWRALERLQILQKVGYEYIVSTTKLTTDVK